MYINLKNVLLLILPKIQAKITFYKFKIISNNTIATLISRLNRD